MRRLPTSSYLLVLLLAIMTSGGLVHTVHATADDPPSLAIYDPGEPDGFFLVPAGEGHLQVADGCMRLLWDHGYLGAVILWPLPTTWNEATGMIEYVSPMRGQHQYWLRPDQHVRLGGLTVRDIDRLDLVTSPAESCGAREHIVLTSLQIVTGGTPREIDRW